MREEEGDWSTWSRMSDWEWENQNHSKKFFCALFLCRRSSRGNINDHPWIQQMVPTTFFLRKLQRISLSLNWRSADVVQRWFKKNHKMNDWLTLRNLVTLLSHDGVSSVIYCFHLIYLERNTIDPWAKRILPIDNSIRTSYSHTMLWC